MKTQRKPDLTLVANCILAIGDSVRLPIGWISDGSTHPSKIVDQASAVDVELCPRGLAIIVQTPCGARRRIVWRMRQVEARMIASWWRDSTFFQKYLVKRVHASKPVAESFVATTMEGANLARLTRDSNGLRVVFC